MKKKKVFLIKANILAFIMFICAFVFIASLSSMIDNFNWVQPFVLIISGYITRELYNSKTLKMWLRIPIKDTKIS